MQEADYTQGLHFKEARITSVSLSPLAHNKESPLKPLDLPVSSQAWQGRVGQGISYLMGSLWVKQYMNYNLVLSHRKGSWPLREPCQELLAMPRLFVSPCLPEHVYLTVPPQDL